MKLKLFFSMVLIFLCGSLLAQTDSLLQKGINEMAQQNYQEASQYFQHSISSRPSFNGYYNLGFAASELKDWQKAKWAFEAALKYDPMNEDAQFNAKYVTQKINPNIEWTNPYSWMDRIILTIGYKVWGFLLTVSSLFMGWFVFRWIVKGSYKQNNIWINRLIIPVCILFLATFYCVNRLNTYYIKESFAIAKEQQIQFHLTPEGIVVKDHSQSLPRMKVIQFSKDETWVQIQTEEKQKFWLKSQDVWMY